MQYNSDLSFCAPVELCSFLTYELLYFMPYRPKILQEISSSWQSPEDVDLDSEQKAVWKLQ